MLARDDGSLENMSREGILIALLVALFATALALPQQQTKSKRPTTPVFQVFESPSVSPSHEYSTRISRSNRIFRYFSQAKTGGLLLPDNATLIREDIVDTFSCRDRIYGYYADMENECQVFHVCLPQTKSAIRWSFICPAETVFNQVNIVSSERRSTPVAT